MMFILGSFDQVDLVRKRGGGDGVATCHTQTECELNCEHDSLVDSMS